MNPQKSPNKTSYFLGGGSIWVGTIYFLPKFWMLKLEEIHARGCEGANWQSSVMPWPSTTISPIRTLWRMFSLLRRTGFSCIEFHPDGFSLGNRSLLLWVRARLNLSSTLLIVVVPSHVSRRSRCWKKLSEVDGKKIATVNATVKKDVVTPRRFPGAPGWFSKIGARLIHLIDTKSRKDAPQNGQESYRNHPKMSCSWVNGWGELWDMR